MAINADVMASLKAKATHTSLDELKARGKTRVRMIRAKDIEGMIHEAVRRALENSNHLDSEQVDEIVSDSQQEFIQLKREQEECERRERQVELGRIQDANSKLEKDNADLRDELHCTIGMLEEQNQKISAEPVQQAAPADGINAGLVMKMMEELMTLKAQIGSVAQGANTQAAAQSAGSTLEDTLAKKLDAIAGSLDSKLEKFGKKMGISAAVDSDVDLGALFDSALDEEVESNMDTVVLKQRKGAGIAGNLEKIKKLRGEG